MLLIVIRLIFHFFLTNQSFIPVCATRSIVSRARHCNAFRDAQARRRSYAVSSLLCRMTAYRPRPFGASHKSASRTPSPFRASVRIAPTIREFVSTNLGTNRPFLVRELSLIQFDLPSLRGSCVGSTYSVEDGPNPVI